MQFPLGKKFDFRTAAAKFLHLALGPSTIQKSKQNCIGRASNQVGHCFSLFFCRGKIKVPPPLLWKYEYKSHGTAPAKVKALKFMGVHLSLTALIKISLMIGFICT